MGSRWIVGVVLLAVAAIAAVVVAVVAQGGDETSSTSEYQAAVVNARDRVDYVLGRISKSTSLDELLERMDEAAAAIDDIAGDVEDQKPTQARKTAHERLVRQLRQLSTDVQATADQARIPGFESIVTEAAGLSFDSWDGVNAALAELREQGIDVQPLSRQTT